MMEMVMVSSNLMRIRDNHSVSKYKITNEWKDEKIEEDQFDTLMQDLKEFDKSLDDLDLALELGLRSEVDIKKKLATLKKALSEATDKSPGDLKSQRRLQARLEEAIQNANIARRSQIAAEEKFRRQNEILEKALTDLRERNKELNEATKQNTSLLLEQMKFTNWNEQVDDDEISQTASRLYQEIETWVKRHFRADENDLCWIYRTISNRIFRTFLVRLMVGIVSDDAEKLLGIAIEALSKEVQKTCKNAFNPYQIKRNY